MWGKAEEEAHLASPLNFIVVNFINFIITIINLIIIVIIVINFNLITILHKIRNMMLISTPQSIFNIGVNHLQLHLSYTCHTVYHDHDYDDEDDKDHANDGIDNDSLWWRWRSRIHIHFMAKAEEGERKNVNALSKEHGSAHFVWKWMFLHFSYIEQ